MSFGVIPPAVRQVIRVLVNYVTRLLVYPWFDIGDTFYKNRASHRNVASASAYDIVFFRLVRDFFSETKVRYTRGNNVAKRVVI